MPTEKIFLILNVKTGFFLAGRRKNVRNYVIYKEYN